MKISKDVEKKALHILKSGGVKLDLETDKRMHFKVRGDSDEHSVIFDKEKNNFICDCKFASLRDGICSHVESSILLLTSKK